LIQYCVPKPEIMLVEAENPTKAIIDFKQSWIHSRQAAHLQKGDFNWTGGCDDLGNGSNHNDDDDHECNRGNGKNDDGGKGKDR